MTWPKIVVTFTDGPLAGQTHEVRDGCSEWVFLNAENKSECYRRLEDRTWTYAGPWYWPRSRWADDE